jgi:anti-sigma factor RsiW
MPCPDLDELLSAYADGQALPAQSEFLELHLRSCVRCQNVLHQYRLTRRLLQTALDDCWVPPDLAGRVAAAERTPQRRLRAMIGLAALTAAVCTLTLRAGGLPRTTAEPGPTPSPVTALPTTPPRLGSAMRYVLIRGHAAPIILMREITDDLSMPGAQTERSSRSPSLGSKGGEAYTRIKRPQAGPLAR